MGVKDNHAPWKKRWMTWRCAATAPSCEISIAEHTRSLIAFLLYLVFHFQGLSRSNDIEKILASWAIPGSPTTARDASPADFSRGIIPISCHSHNDYERQVPLYEALNVGCTSVEADIWLRDQDLLVGHTEDSLTPARTLRSLYLNPLLSILNCQNPGLVHTSGLGRSLTPQGVYTSSPHTSVALLIDLKTSSADALPVLQDQLSSLRSQHFLTYFNGTDLIQGPMTVVSTGNTDFHTLISNTTYRDVFFDAPLDHLWGEDSPTDATLYNDENSYYASVSFASSIGKTWLGTLVPQQVYKIRGQIKGAHEKGLKVRYWDTPAWPKSLRNHIWDLLLREGTDILNVDDLKAARDFL
ncbi:MAG: hypothetical protein Q9181_001920 [Wetmoreana brouardii]